MKKLVIILATGMLTSVAVAQNDIKQVTPPPPLEVTDLPMLPPPPPAPPPPPPARPLQKVKFIQRGNLNEKGYAVTIQQTKEDNIIILHKNGLTQKIKMSVWNAKPDYFESKYGKLPPPPPPLPPTPPVTPNPPVKK
jgi:hypothetical protein